MGWFVSNRRPRACLGMVKNFHCLYIFAFVMGVGLTSPIPFVLPTALSLASRCLSVKFFG